MGVIVTKREKIELELNAMKKSGCWSVSDISAFIIDDRKRIVAPIEAYREIVGTSGDMWPQFECDIAIEQTLTNAGVSNE